MFESIFSAIASESNFSVGNLLMGIGAALVLGLLISFVYIKTHKSAPSRSFALTLVMLPAIISVIILLIGNSIARAFSLAGAFQIIRFRSTPGDAKDITYVLFTMAVGLFCGMGFLLYGAIVAVVLCAVMAVLELTRFGQPKQEGKLLKITIPESLDYAHAFDEVFQQHTTRQKLLKVKTADLGSLFELQYEIMQKNDSDDKQLIDDLRCRNGNLSITLVLAAKNSEF